VLWVIIIEVFDYASLCPQERGIVPAQLSVAVFLLYSPSAVPLISSLLLAIQRNNNSGRLQIPPPFSAHLSEIYSSQQLLFQFLVQLVSEFLVRGFDQTHDGHHCLLKVFSEGYHIRWEERIKQRTPFERLEGTGCQFLG